MEDSPFKTKAFRKLQATWYKKLASKEVGFEDIENKDGTLKNTTDPRTIAEAYKDKEMRETYYSIARDFLRLYQFASTLDKEVWRGHCEGIGAYTIAKNLGIKRHKAESIIVRCQKLAKLK